MSAMNFWNTISFFGFIFLLLSCEGPAEQSERPNIIYILADDGLWRFKCLWRHQSANAQY